MLVCGLPMNYRTVYKQYDFLRREKLKIYPSCSKGTVKIKKTKCLKIIWSVDIQCDNEVNVYSKTFLFRASVFWSETGCTQQFDFQTSINFSTI